MKNFYFAFVCFGVFIEIACTTSSERFRTQASTQHSIKYKSPVHLKVTGTGCALDVETAMRISRNTAQYNLRSAIGDAKYSVRLREINRYEENGQVCIESEAESQTP